MNRECDRDCDCCSGITASTPQPVHNRPGLSEVLYRPGGYAEFRASMHAALTSAQRPALAALTTRDEDDLSVALLDGAACVGEVITFYTERLVNEAFLRTAKDRLSLAELGKLVGYRLRPGVAALTQLAFHVEPPPPPAVAAATSPFRKVRMPAAVNIPAGVQVRSIPGPGEQQQVFETGAAIEARPEWNLMRPVTTKPTVLGGPAKSMYVKGITTNLKAGDVILFFGDNSRWEIRTITTVKPQNEHDRTLVTWRDPLSKAAPLQPFAMRKRLNVFGYNAPRWEAMSKQFRKDYGCKDCTLWPDYFIYPTDEELGCDIDGSHPDILQDHHLVLKAGLSVAHFKVADVSERSLARFSLSGRVTRVLLTGSFDDYLKFWKLVRQTTVFAVDEELELADEPEDPNVHYGPIVLAGDVTTLPLGRTIVVAGGGKAELAMVKSVKANGQNTTVEFTGNLANSYPRATVALFGNVVAATHGETVHQILGDGQAGQPFQRFELKHAPLTFAPSADPAGSVSTLEVRVNDVAWHENPSLYQAKPDDRVFATRDNPAGVVEVRFGDGLRGVRVPSGQHNIRAKYRKGTGVSGNLPAGALTQLTAPPLGVTGVTNPAEASGGADADSVQHARQGIPLSTRTLGRAVSVTDYADFARTFSGIAKAHAAVIALRHVRTIVVTVAGAGGAKVPDVTRAKLTTALRGHGDPLVQILVVPHRSVPFQVRMKVKCDPDYETGKVFNGVAAALQEAFGFDAREFTQPVQRSEVIRAAHRAASVVAVDLDYLFRGTTLSNAPPLIAAGPQASASQVDGAELLVITADPVPWLTEMS